MHSLPILTKQRSILGDLLEIPATFFSPSQPGCNTERWTVGRDVQPSLLILPLDWHKST
ncbi:Hypothetical predicted protein [Lynx pardinus]|uniref:Uncharacterized protein n=1 Tax=Lynx pardinus TaxID=191816 RepID=A0A485N6F9_LYNPA|nr:Hypothetical predicted protein [Lynx pardinus]